MVHFTCDLCNQDLGEENRYTVTVEIQAVQPGQTLTEEDLEDDHLESVSQLLNELEDTGETPTVESPTQTLRFDLCAHCRTRFLNDPLGKSSRPKVFFSEN